MTKAVGKLKPQADAHGPNVLRVREDAYKTGVLKSLEMCRVRVSSDDYETLSLTYQDIFDARPGKFHWKNGGVFKTELRALAIGVDSDESDDEGIDTTGPSGLFQDWEQVKIHRVRPEPESICVGMMVAVDTAGDLHQVEGPPSKFGFRLGRVVRVDRVMQHVTIQWWCTSATVFAQKQLWRPWLTQSLHIVKATACFYTFLDLTAQGRLRAGNFRSLQYILECREAEKDLEAIRAGVSKLVPPEFNDVSSFTQEDS